MFHRIRTDLDETLNRTEPFSSPAIGFSKVLIVDLCAQFTNTFEYQFLILISMQ